MMERNQRRAAQEAQQAAVLRVEELKRELADARDGAHKEKYDIIEAGASTRNDLLAVQQELAEARGGPAWPPWPAPVARGDPHPWPAPVAKGTPPPWSATSLAGR